MPAPCGLGKNSRRFGSAVGIGVTGPNLIRLADRPCRAPDRPYEAPSHLKREGRAFGGGGTAHPDLGKARGDAFRRRSIGTLAGTAQVWLRQVGMRIALYQPDIPQNTGTILRLCGCLGVEAHIIEPAGFPSSDRAFRRAGMDYLDAVAINRHASWSDFDAWRRRAACRVVCSPPRRTCPISTSTLHWVMCFCSAANRRACPRRSMPQPMRGFAFRCGRECVRSMSPWPSRSAPAKP
jgi:hypothetical protein